MAWQAAAITARTESLQQLALSTHWAPKWECQNCCTAKTLLSTKFLSPWIGCKP